jgi:hypothetical protein
MTRRPTRRREAVERIHCVITGSSAGAHRVVGAHRPAAIGCGGRALPGRSGATRRRRPGLEPDPTPRPGDAPLRVGSRPQSPAPRPPHPSPGRVSREHAPSPAAGGGAPRARRHRLGGHADGPGPLRPLTAQGALPELPGLPCGVADTTRSIWPTEEGCATCHDGTVEKRLEWEPPSGLPRTNLRFTHAEHRGEYRRPIPGRSIPCSPAPRATARPAPRECRSGSPSPELPGLPRDRGGSPGGAGHGVRHLSRPAGPRRSAHGPGRERVPGA